MCICVNLVIQAFQIPGFFSDLLGSTYPFVVLTLSTMSIMTAQFSSVFISLVAFSRTRKSKKYRHVFLVQLCHISLRDSYLHKDKGLDFKWRNKLISVKWLNVSRQSTVDICNLLHVWFSLIFLQKSFVFIYQ